MKSSHYLLLAVAVLGLALVGWLLLPGEQPTPSNGPSRPGVMTDAVARSLPSAAGDAPAAPPVAPPGQPESSVPDVSASETPQARPPLEPNPAAGPAAAPKAARKQARASDLWRGRILDRTSGDPVVAAVEQHSSSGSDRTTSDERGYFELPWPELGPASVTIQASGYVTAHWPALANPPLDNLWLDAHGECEVFAKDGQRLGNDVLLEFWKLTGKPLEAGVGRQVLAKANQPASVEGLEPGLYLVAAQRVLPPAPQRVPAEQGRAWLSGVRIESHRQTRAELELPPVIDLEFSFDLGEQQSTPTWLSLGPTASPLTAALLGPSLLTELFERPTEKGFHYGTSVPIGVFPGTLRAAILTSWGSREEFEVTYDASGRVPLERVTPPAALAGRVIDAEERPLRALIGVVRADALAELAEFVALAQLVSANSKANSRTQVSRELLDRPGPPSPVQWTLTGSDGRYFLDRVPAAVPLVVLAWPTEACGYHSTLHPAGETSSPLNPWPQAQVIESAVVGEVEELDFRLLAGRRLDVSAALPGGSPAVGAEVEPFLEELGTRFSVWDHSRQTYAIARILPLPSVHLDSQGRGTLWLPPEAVRLEIRSVGTRPFTHHHPELNPKKVDHGARLEVVLEPDRMLSGYVIDLAGTAIPGARVTLRLGGIERSQRTDLEGRYLFSGLSAGSGSLEASGWMLKAGPEARAAVKIGQIPVPSLVLGRYPLPLLKTLRGSAGSNAGPEQVPGLWQEGAGNQAVVSYTEQGFVISGMDPVLESLTLHAPWHLPLALPRDRLSFAGQLTLERVQLLSLARISIWPCDKLEGWQWRSALDSPPEGVLSAFSGDDLERRGDLMFAFAPKWRCILEHSSSGVSIEVDLGVPGEQESLKEAASDNTSAGAAKSERLNLRIQH
jgi:hypothetical protein